MQPNAIATPETRAAKAEAKATDARQAMREAMAEATRVNANTDRLKALRLARDARERPPSPPARRQRR